MAVSVIAKKVGKDRSAISRKPIAAWLIVPDMVSASAVLAVVKKVGRATLAKRSTAKIRPARITAPASRANATVRQVGRGIGVTLSTNRYINAYRVVPIMACMIWNRRNASVIDIGPVLIVHKVKLFFYYYFIKLKNHHTLTTKLHTAKLLMMTSYLSIYSFLILKR